MPIDFGPQPIPATYAPPDFKQISGLADSYWAGLDEAYKRRKENAFKDGLPTILPDDPRYNPKNPNALDVNAIAETVARVGGADKALPAITAAGGAEADQNISGLLSGLRQNGPSPLFPNARANPNPDGAPPAPAPATGPPSLSRQLPPPGQLNGAGDAGGNPAAQNTIAGAVLSSGLPPADARQAALEIASRTGKGVRDQLDQGDNVHVDGVIQTARARLAQAGGQQPPPGGAPQPGPPLQLQGATFDQRFQPNGQGPQQPPQAGPQGSPQGPPQGEPQGPPQGAPGGATTLAGIVGARLPPGPAADQVVAALSRSAGVDPQAPVPPEQAGRVAQLVDAYGKRNNIPPPAAAAPPNQPAEDQTAGGLVPQWWIDRGGTIGTYRDAIGAAAAQRGAAPGTQAAALERMKAIDRYLVEKATPTPDLKLYNAAVAHGYRGTPQQFQGDIAEMKKTGEVNAENLALTPTQKEFRDSRRPGESLPEYEARKAGLKNSAEGIAGAGVDTFKEAGKNYAVAQSTKFRLDLIDKSIDELGSQWMGSAADTRARAAKAWNTFAESSLAPDIAKRNMINPNKIATWEDFNKQTLNLGFEMARTLGAREAMQVVQQATNSVPNANQTPLGAKLVSASLRQVVQRQTDYYEYLSERPGQVGAEVQFNRENPPEKYSLRAIASAGAPVKISSKVEYGWLPSGATFIKDGRSWRKP